MEISTLVKLARQHGFAIEPVEESSRYVLIPTKTAKLGFPTGLLTLQEIVRYLQSINSSNPVLRVCLLNQPPAIVIQSNLTGLAVLKTVVDEAFKGGAGQAAVECQVRDTSHPIMLYCTTGISQNPISFAELI